MLVMLSLPVLVVETVAADAHDAGLPGAAGVWCATVPADAHDAFPAEVLAWKVLQLMLMMLGLPVCRLELPGVEYGNWKLSQPMSSPLAADAHDAGLPALIIW